MADNLNYRDLNDPRHTLACACTCFTRTFKLAYRGSERVCWFLGGRWKTQFGASPTTLVVGTSPPRVSASTGTGIAKAISALFHRVRESLSRQETGTWDAAFFFVFTGHRLADVCVCVYIYCERGTRTLSGNVAKSSDSRRKHDPPELPARVNKRASRPINRLNDRTFNWPLRADFCCTNSSFWNRKFQNDQNQIFYIFIRTDARVSFFFSNETVNLLKATSIF